MRRFIAGALALVIAQACTYSSVTAPHSSPVPIGETVSYTIYTTCGLDAMAFDIDGSLWVPTTIEPADREGTPSGFENPDDVGTLRLVSDQSAEYVTSRGRTIALRRLPGDFTAEGC